jgi:hypothetical protein
MVVACLGVLTLAHASEGGEPLRAGTGRASIDPPSALLPIRNNNDSPLTGVHDSLYSRAVVLESGPTRAILVVSDVIILPDELYERAVERIATTYSVPRDHIFLSATHAHTVPWSFEHGYADTVVQGMLAAIAEGRQHLEPVTVGIGSGRAFINMNRDELTPKGFILGQDPEGVSDKTVRVAGLFRADGSALAILSNYAVHAVALYSSDTVGKGAAMVSADITGVVDRFVDERYAASRTLSLWTSGAAGEQNPVQMSFNAEPQSNGTVLATDLGPAGLVLTERLGQALAREVVRVADRLKPAAATQPLRAAQVVVRCPSKLDPSKDLPIRISHLGIGPLDLIGVSGELATPVDQRLRERIGARADRLQTLTLTNGYSGYLPDDASYARGTSFEVTKTSFAAGCAEDRIVAAALGLLAIGNE